MWVLALIESNWFAKGLQIYQRDETGKDEPKYKYHYGSHLVFLNPIFESTVDGLELEWVDIKQERTPSFFEKLKKKLFGIGFDEYCYNRPESGEIVAVDYGNNFMEIAEFSKNGDHFLWVTELNSYMTPVRWARLPKHILDMANNKHK